jgi:hypothetical protein
MYKTVLQDKSTWSFRVELRPFGETWWSFLAILTL